jgi:hypothetical protein
MLYVNQKLIFFFSTFNDKLKLNFNSNFFERIKGSSFTVKCIYFYSQLNEAETGFKKDIYLYLIICNFNF